VVTVFAVLEFFSCGNRVVGGVSAQSYLHDTAKVSAMHNVTLACAAGTLLALAFPYPSLWPLAWVALIPLCLALSRQRVMTGFGLGYVFGLVFLGITLRWSAALDPGLWVAFVLIEALLCALFGAIAAWFYRTPAGHVGWRPVAIACTWTLIEYLRMQGEYALTWSQLSYSQLPSEVIVQMADVTGAIGVTFVIVLVNASLAEFLLWREQKGRGHKPPSSIRGCAMWSGVVVLVCLLYGAVRIFTLPQLTSDVSTVACVQPNVDAYTKWDPQKRMDSVQALEAQTIQAAANGAYLVVWPETAVPIFVLQDPALLGRLQALARRLKVFILVGAPDMSAQKELFNTAFLIDPQGTLQGRYDKMHLVPLGEFLPLRSLLGKIPVFSPIDDCTAGQVPTVFHTPRFNFSTLICFESTFSDLSRDFVRDGAQLLVVITNDGWFKRSSAAEHHLAMSAMRAIEERIEVIQCGNTGLSAFIDPLGRYHGETQLFEATVTSDPVQPGSLGSIYQRFGDWFMAVVIVLFALCVVGHKRSKGTIRE